MASRLNTDALYGVDSLTEKIMQTAKNSSVELKGVLDIVSGILDKSGKLDNAQKSIIGKFKEQQKYLEKIEEINKQNLSNKEREQKLDELNNEMAQEAVTILLKRQAALLEYSSLEEKLQNQTIFRERQHQQILEERKVLQNELIDIKDKLANSQASENKEETQKLEEELRRAEEQLREKNQDLAQAKKDLQRSREDQWTAETHSAFEAQEIIAAKNHNRRLSDLQSEVREKEKERKSLRGLDDPKSREQDRLLREAIKTLSEEISELGGAVSEESKSSAGLLIGGKSVAELGGLGGALKEAFGFSSKGLKDIIGELASKAISAASKAFDQSVEKAVGLYNDYALKTNFRMEAIMSGNQKYFDDMVGQVQNLLSYNGSIRQEDLIRQISSAVDQGIAYNVEQRAFLQTVSDNIQSTFDAFNSNLTRIIRIQQADSTIQRLGMEKALNDMLTDYFKDSSYLQNTYDAVSDALFEATATQSREQAVETEFVVQKWLGSLYSLGASNNVINQIATGLGYLGSGNVSALAGNMPLQSLLAISASRSGQDYAELLTSGLDPEKTNKLMQSMVEYLAEIADSTSENRVVTSAFGNIFGMSISDIKSFQNLASSISNISSETMDFSQAGGYTQRALNNYLGYMSMSQMYSNFFENAKLGAGLDFANGPSYLMYKAVDLIQDLSGGGADMEIAPFGIGIKFNPFDMIKTGMFGLGLISNLISGFGSGQGNALDLRRWGYEDVVTRGTGFGLRNTQGLSFSTTVGNSSSSDIEKQTLKEGQEKAKQVKSETGETEEEEALKGIYHGLVNPGEKAKLTALVTKTEDVNNNLKRAYNILRQTSAENSKKSFNVNIKSINGQDVEKGILKTSPDDQWKTLIKGAAILIKYGQLVGGFDDQFLRRIAAEAENNQEQYTLQDLIDLMVPQLESDTGLPVRLESVDSMTNLMADLRNR